MADLVRHVETGGSSRRPPAAEWQDVAGLTLLSGSLVAAVTGHDRLTVVLSAPAVSAWQTVFVALVVQALPFLVLVWRSAG